MSEHGAADGFGSLKTQQDEPHVLIWKPSRDLATCLPTGFEIRLALLETGEHRRIVPVAVGDFCLQAALVGEAISQLRNRFTAEELATYRMMRFLFQLGGQLRERVDDRSFKSFRELYIARTVKWPGDYRDILPDDFGMLSPSGSRWSVQRLGKMGRQTAQEAGIANPMAEETIIFGINAEAWVHPLNLDAMTLKEKLYLVTSALFEIDSAAPAPESASHDLRSLTELKESVYGRLVDAIEKHVAANGQEFHRWLYDEFDSIIKQISTRKRPDGPIPRELVRQAILQLSVESWCYLGSTIAVFTQLLREQVRHQLSSRDLVAFDVLYAPTPEFAGIPLILLYEQFRIVRPTIEKLLDGQSDSGLWGSLHRVLQTFATMVKRRRQADRLRDRTAPKGGPSLFSVPNRASIRRKLIRRLLECESISCWCGNAADWDVELPEDWESESIINLTMICLECGKRHPILKTLEAFQSLLN